MTKEFLIKQIENLNAQREQYLAQAHAASGAIELANYLIDNWDNKDALTIPELEEMIGGKVQSIDEVPNAKKEKETV